MMLLGNTYSSSTGKERYNTVPVVPAVPYTFQSPYPRIKPPGEILVGMIVGGTGDG
jgi:hypothetical protein